jgi:type VI secretion system protein ImpG
MPIGVGQTDFALDAAAPVERVRVISGPSRPYVPIADGAVAWRAISHLTLNYLSLVDSTETQGAAALRELLDLYTVAGDASARKQIEGIRSVRVSPVVRRLPPSRDPASRGGGPALTFGRGLEITVEVDELAFEGGSAYVLGAILEQFFARHVSMNSFTETVLRTQSRGEINRWQPHWGTRPTL